MAIFTREELATYLQVDLADISTDTSNLLNTLVTTEIVNTIGQARFDAVDVARFLAVGLDMAKRMHVNPKGLRSTQASIDDYSTTNTYASETIVSTQATADEQRRIRRAAKLNRQFTIAVTE